MKKIVFAFLCCWGLTGCASYLAKVNQEVITGKTLTEEFVGRHGGHRKILAGPAEIRKFLDVVIDKRLIVLEAYRIGLDDAPDIRPMVADFTTNAELAYLIEQEIRKKAEPNEAEVKYVYDHKLGEMVMIRQIAVTSKKEAEELRKQLLAGEDFEKLVREKSIAASAKYGGRLPPAAWGTMEPEWERIAFGLEKGELSPVFKGSEGYEIIRLDSRLKHLEEAVQVRQIVVQSKDEGEEILKRLRAGEDFEKLARERSIAPSAQQGGKLLPVEWSGLDPEWDRVVLNLKEGELSPVLKNGEEYEIVRMETRSRAQRPEFDKVKDKIQAVLQDRKLAEREKEFLALLRKKYNVQTAPDLGLETLTKATEEKEDYPATWTGGALSLAEFAKKVKLDDLAKLPPDEYPEVIGSMLDEAVTGELLKLEAVSRGYGNIPEIAEKARRYREELMEAKMYADYIMPDKGVAVADEELLPYFESHRNDFIVPETRYVAHIVVKSPEIAREVLDKIRQGEPYPELVKAYSQDTQTVKMGGVLGWIKKSDVPPEFNEVMSLRAEECGGPYKSDYGYHIIKVLKIQPERLKDFAEVKEDVRKSMLQVKKKEKIKFWTDKLRSFATVEINERGIRAFVEENAAL